MFERKVAQYSFVEGLGLFDHRFHSGCRASEERTDQFRNATQIANRGLDGTRPFTAVLCVFPSIRVEQPRFWPVRRAFRRPGSRCASDRGGCVTG